MSNVDSQNVYLQFLIFLISNAWLPLTYNRWNWEDFTLISFTITKFCIISHPTTLAIFLPSTLLRHHSATVNNYFSTLDPVIEYCFLLFVAVQLIVGTISHLAYKIPIPYRVLKNIYTTSTLPRFYMAVVIPSWETFYVRLIYSSFCCCVFCF